MSASSRLKNDNHRSWLQKGASIQALEYCGGPLALRLPPNLPFPLPLRPAHPGRPKLAALSSPRLMFECALHQLSSVSSPPDATHLLMPSTSNPSVASLACIGCHLPDLVGKQPCLFPSVQQLEWVLLCLAAAPTEHMPLAVACEDWDTALDQVVFFHWLRALHGSLNGSDALVIQHASMPLHICKGHYKCLFWFAFMF